MNENKIENREQKYKKEICKYCKSNCNKKIVISNEDNIICTKCLNYKPKEIIKRKKSIQFWQKW